MRYETVQSAQGGDRAAPLPACRETSSRASSSGSRSSVDRPCRRAAGYTGRPDSVRASMQSQWYEQRQARHRCRRVHHRRRAIGILLATAIAVASIPVMVVVATALMRHARGIALVPTLISTSSACSSRDVRRFAANHARARRDVRIGSMLVVTDGLIRWRAVHAPDSRIRASPV